MPVLAVLVRTHNPGNLGAAARAAKNFGAELLVVDRAWRCCTPTQWHSPPEQKIFLEG
ncbi:MAG: hypothetical protein IPL89_05240 [Acidobacteria bacterium]|nr:hypothetical protein [Acidobacteriota bacterium]